MTATAPKKSATTNPLKILSVNCYSMGHVAYQLGLERIFAEHARDVAFQSVHLSEVNRSDLLGRVAYRLLTPRLPGCGDRDHDWIRLRGELAGSLFLRRRLQRMLPVACPDVLHLHTQSIALLCRDIMRKVPTVITIDCTSALLSRIHPAPAARTYRPIVRLERECFAAAAHVVSFSEIARRSVIEDYGISPERISVILPTVPRARLPEHKAHATGGKLRLLFVGNDFKRKGGEDLVAVFCEHLRGSCELDVVSNGVAELPNVEGLRLHKGLTAFSAPLMQLYADADVFVMPTHEDALGLVYLEAMAAGLPCIGTDVLAVPELLGKEQRGVTVVPGDRRQLAEAIGRLAREPDLRVRLGQAGRAFVQAECDDATNCGKLSRLFERCAMERASGSRPPPLTGAGERAAEGVVCN